MTNEKSHTCDNDDCYRHGLDLARVKRILTAAECEPEDLPEEFHPHLGFLVGAVNNVIQYSTISACRCEQGEPDSCFDNGRAFMSGYRQFCREVGAHPISEIIKGINLIARLVFFTDADDRAPDSGPLPVHAVYNLLNQASVLLHAVLPVCETHGSHVTRNAYIEAEAATRGCLEHLDIDEMFGTMN